MATGRRVVITGVSGHWGSELARRLERDPAVDTSPGSTRAPPRGGPRAHRVHRGRHPQPAAVADPAGHRGRHRGPLRHPAGTRSPGKPARALHDINVIGTLQLLAACERTPTLERVIVRGSAAIYGCEGATPVLLHRGPGAADAAAHPLPARHLRARGVLLELRPPPPGDHLLHAALSARDRPRPRHAARALPVAAGGPDAARLRPPPAADARRGRDRRAAGRDPQRRAGRGQRRAERVDLAQPRPAPRAPPAPWASRIRCSSPRWPGSATGSASGALWGDGVRLLRYRPRGRQHPAARGGRLRAGLRRRGRRPRLRRAASVAAGSAPTSIRARWSTGSPGPARERAVGRGAPEARRGLPAPAAPRASRAGWIR